MSNPTTTGQWTVDGCNVWLPERNAFECVNEKYARFAAERHNAALAAERERSRAGGWLSQEALDEYAKVEEEHRKLKEQLAAERNQTDLWKRQAAFESEHREKYRSRNIEDAKTIQQLREQLAAESEEGGGKKIC